MSWIIDKLTNVSDWFYSVYLAVADWVWPFNQAADFFYEVSWVFIRLAWDFYDFSVWVDDIATKIVTILSWDIIWSFILEKVPKLEDIRDWFYAWQLHIWQELTNWWSATSTDVLGWIDIAKNDLLTWINWLHTQIIELRGDVEDLIGQIPDISEIRAWFSNWWGNILVNLSTWWNDRLLEVQRLIDTAFSLREPFWAGWQEIRDKVFEFFDDPLEWLLERFTNWFLGPEE